MLANWLNACSYKSQYHPVPTEQYLVCENFIYSSSNLPLYSPSQPTSTCSKSHAQAIRFIQPSKCKALNNPVINAVVSLTIESVRVGHGVLIFCNARHGCQSTAALISEAMSCAIEPTPEVLGMRRDVLSELRNLSVGLDDMLGNLVLKGVAFHRT